MKLRVRIVGSGLLVWSAVVCGGGCLPELRVIRGCRDGSLCDAGRDHDEVGEETAVEDRAEVMDAAGAEVGDGGGDGGVDAGGMDAVAEVGAEAGMDAAVDAGMDAGMVCASGLTECEGRCVSLRDDARNCGACGMACAAPDGGTVGCAEGRCVPMCGAGMGVVGGACVVIRAPRPVAPLSTATVTSHRPTLRWALGEGTDGARVELCRERACTAVVMTLDASGTSVRPTTDLTPGVWFWRLRGRVGGANGTVVGPTWQFNVGARSAPVDTSWGHTSDFNGDGYADLLVGDGDTVRYYQGSASGIRTGSYTSLRYGSESGFLWSLASAGDLNGDGFADIVLGRSGMSSVCIFWGSLAGPSTTPDVVIRLEGVFLQVEADGIGDFDGDGFGDIVGYGSDVNEAAIYFGAATGPTLVSRRVIGEQSCVAVGDVNGDGLSELATNGVAGVSILYGVPRSTIAIPIVVLPGTLTTKYSAAGDIDGDGRADLVLDVGTSSSLRRRIYLGAATGAPVGGWNATIGAEVAPLGDTNGDGFDDIALLSSANSQMQVYTGNGIVGPSLIGSLSYARNDLFGEGNGATRGVVALGDVNGDGYRDVAIGAEGVRSVYLFHGRPVGFPSTAATVLTEGVGVNFGGVVAMTLPGRNPRRTARPHIPSERIEMVVD